MGQLTLLEMQAYVDIIYLLHTSKLNYARILPVIFLLK